jgi:hypothetical protein
MALRCVKTSDKPPFYGFAYRIEKDGNPVETWLNVNKNKQSFCIKECDNNNAIVMDIKEHKILYTFDTEADYSIGFFNNLYYAYDSYNESISVIDVTNNTKRTISHNVGECNKFILSHDGKYIITFWYDILCIFNIETEDWYEHIFVGTDRSEEYLKDIAITGNNIVIILFKKCVVCFNLNTHIYEIHYNFTDEELTVSIENNDLHSIVASQPRVSRADDIVAGRDGDRVALVNKLTNESVSFIPFLERSNILYFERIVFFYKMETIFAENDGRMFIFKNGNRVYFDTPLHGVNLNANDSSMYCGSETFFYKKENTNEDVLHVINIESYLRSLENYERN